MRKITDTATLESLYPKASPGAVTKVCDHLTPHYRTWIGAARFVVLSTVGPEGTDGSPRGDIEPVVRIVDDHTLMLPDWRGNNRLDTLRNIINDDRISLMFMVPGSNNVVRVNGTAVLTDDAALTASFVRDDKTPATVLVITVQELYFQCAKAVMRAQIWSGEDHSAALPSAGDFLKEVKNDFDGASYDAGYADYAKARMWGDPD